MIAQIYSIFQMIIEFATDVWQFLNTSINDMISDIGLNVSVPIIGEFTLLYLSIGFVGAFIVYTLVKWVVGL